MASGKRRTPPPQSNPIRRRRAGGRKWSWDEAASRLNVSAKWLRFNLDSLPPGLSSKMESYINGD